MSKERFLQRKSGVRENAARLAEAVAQTESSPVRDAVIQRFEALSKRIYGHIVTNHASLLGEMAQRIEALPWE